MGDFDMKSWNEEIIFGAYIQMGRYECHSFSCSFQLEHRAPFGVSVITYILRHTVGLPWTSGQPVAEASTYTGQHNI
jgi:hypothetical protein